MDVGKAHGKGAGELQVLRGLVLGERYHNLMGIVLPGPGGHHDVRVPVFIPGGNHHTRLRCGHKGMVGAEVLAPGNLFQGFVVVHSICVLLILATDGHHSQGNGQE